MDQKVEQVTLAGQKAIDLWLKGTTAWNQWVEFNPEAEVDFSGVDFSHYRQVKLKHTPYSNPQSKVDIDLKALRFQRPRIDFRNYQFPNGLISFEKANFGDGVVDFSYANFGEGGVIFKQANFGHSLTSFEASIFGGGKADFQFTSFGQGYIAFERARFLNCQVSFWHSDFKNGYVDFEDPVISGKGKLSFSHSKFEETANFKNCILAGDICFYGIESKKVFYFAPKDVMACTSISFESGNFLGNFLLDKFICPVPIDLRHTSISRPLDLHNIKFDFKSEPYLYLFSRSCDPEDASRFRRLKKLAKESDDQVRTLSFFANEMRSSYWHSLKGQKPLSSISMIGSVTTVAAY